MRGGMTGSIGLTSGVFPNPVSQYIPYNIQLLSTSVRAYGEYVGYVWGTVNNICKCGGGYVKEAGFLTLSDGYGACALVIGRGNEMKYGGGGGSIWGDVDMTVEAVEGGELEIARRRDF